MAYLLEQKKVNRISIFVILFKNDRSFFVGKTPEKNLKITYKNHYYLMNQKTKNMFMRARAEEISPPIYQIYTVEGTEKEAFSHCVAWVKYFMEQGLTSLCGAKLDDYANNLNESTATIFNQIKDKNIDEVCPDGADLYCDFGRLKQNKTDSENNFIGFRVTPEEYQEITNAASAAGVSTTTYCKSLALSGCVKVVDKHIFTALSKYIDQFSTRDILLKNLLEEIYSSKNYMPADLAIIQESISENASHQRDAINDVKELLQQLLNT